MSFIDSHTIGVGVFMTTATHPLTYCKVLIQLGHEPLSPVLRRNVFFRKQLQYPNAYQYMKHIKTTDGFFGLYRGLVPRICANVSTSITYMTAHHVLNQNFKREEVPAVESADAALVLKKVVSDSCREMTAKCCAVLVSQPFHVIAIRSMAQFVGHETYYSSLASSVREIYHQDGILGFFVGLAPRLVAEIAQIWICNLLAYLLDTYILNDQSDMKDLRQYSHAVTSYIAGILTYPVNLASNVVVVTGSRLAAGNPPHMPVYDGWWSCLTDLRKMGLTGRGSSLIFRPALRYAVQATSVTAMPPPPIPK